MPKSAIKQGNKRAVILAVLIFTISYLISLSLWVQVQDYYSYVVTYIASNLIEGIKDVELHKIVLKEDLIKAVFSYSFPGSSRPYILMNVPVKTSSYTFNAPLTFGIMAVMYPFIVRKRRAYAEALIILVSVHLLYIISLEAKVLTETMVSTGIEPVNKLRIFFYQFLWGFTDNMVITCEPFLVGFYMFVRFRK